MTAFLMIFWGFPTTFQKFSKIVPKERQNFPNILRTFSQDYQRFPKTKKISEEGPMIFWSFSNTSKYFLRDYVTTAMVIILVTKATSTSSHVKDKNSIFTACNEEMRICMASQAWQKWVELKTTYRVSVIVVWDWEITVRDWKITTWD